MNQKKVKFNIVDIIVILILIAGIVFVGAKMLATEEPEVTADPANVSPYLVTFHAECIQEEVANSLVMGSRSENTSRNMDLGTLVDFTIGESVIFSFDKDGNCVQSTKPGYVSVTLVCRLDGVQTPTGLLVGQYMLNVGHNMGVRCGNTEINCNIRNIAPAAE